MKNEYEKLEKQELKSVFLSIIKLMYMNRFSCLEMRDMVKEVSRKTDKSLNKMD